MWVPADPHVTVPAGTASQYWFMMVPQVSAVPNNPRNRFCSPLAAPAGSFDHWVPQNTRYTAGFGDTTPVLALDPTDKVLLASGRTAFGCIGLTPYRATDPAAGRVAASTVWAVPKAARPATRPAMSTRGSMGERRISMTPSVATSEAGQGCYAPGRPADPAAAPGPLVSWSVATSGCCRRCRSRFRPGCRWWSPRRSRRGRGRTRRRRWCRRR